MSVVQYGTIIRSRTGERRKNGTGTLVVEDGSKQSLWVGEGKIRSRTRVRGGSVKDQFVCSSSDRGHGKGVCVVKSNVKWMLEGRVEVVNWRLFVDDSSTPHHGPRQLQ
jgi:hypothetical protein